MTEDVLSMSIFMLQGTPQFNKDCFAPNAFVSTSLQRFRFVSNEISRHLDQLNQHLYRHNFQLHSVVSFKNVKNTLEIFKVNQNRFHSHLTRKTLI